MAQDIEMKKVNPKKNKRTQRQANKEKELSRQREIYAKSSEKKEKKRISYEKKQSDLAKKEGWVYTSNYQFKKEMEELNCEKTKSFHDQNKAKLSCDYCEKKYTTQSLLKHIGRNEDCKTYYGSRFDELKRERDRKRKKTERSNKNLELGQNLP